MMTMEKISWNYDDISSNLIVIMCNNKSIGYIKIDSDDFIIISESMEHPSIKMMILRQVVNEYPEALITAKKMLKMQ